MSAVRSEPPCPTNCKLEQPSVSKNQVPPPSPKSQNRTPPSPKTIGCQESLPQEPHLIDVQVITEPSIEPAESIDESIVVEPRRGSKEELLSRNKEVVKHSIWSIWSIGSSIEKKYFDIAVAVLILLQAVLFGIDAENTIQHPARERPAWIVIVNFCLDVIFALEIIYRIVDENRAFIRYTNPNFCWNILDTCTVLCSIVELLTTIIYAWEGHSALQALRSLRLLRLFRVVRIVRLVRFFTEMQVLLSAISGNVKPILCAALLLTIIVYMFASIVLFVVGEERVQVVNFGKSPGEGYGYLQKNYGGVRQTMFTLFLAISGGTDWETAADPLIEAAPLMQLLFVFYIGFALYCVLNIITGVFVEYARKSGASDEVVLAEHLDRRDHFYEEVRALFELADENQDGVVDAQEFSHVLENVKFEALCAEVGLNIEGYSAIGLFNLFDFDKKGELTYTDFADGMLHLHGNARSLDVYLLRRDQKSFMEQFGVLCASLGVAIKGEAPDSPRRRSSKERAMKEWEPTSSHATPRRVSRTRSC